MLNEPIPDPAPTGGGGGPGGAGGVGGGTSGGGQMSYIQVTPQEKEAIERVRWSMTMSRTCFFIYLLLSKNTGA